MGTDLFLAQQRAKTSHMSEKAEVNSTHRLLSRTAWWNE
ncbi:hypothetical protein SM11_pC0142 (plasmid) [Sinorhizobium meliloti SM11]|uniref:Uncharacterized protein n=1 Tax=Sinorhizobium meliloti (strain SM11) TaxID=707241 RepID=F7XBB2_SINMM|nr:hypothetical protein SM11_pC0142 [Sinorhizobium meliloti SM11]